MQKFKVSVYVNKKVVNKAWDGMERNSTVRNITDRKGLA